MKRTARNLITALCCTGLLAAAGCSNAGELSVTGMYGSQGQALSGDRCDELLMRAADADTAESEEEAKEEYRQCVEDALDEDGRDGECRDRDDATCDIILDEVGDAVRRLREDAGIEAPDCANPAAGGETALCHLIAAYEACELDHNGDGQPDVDDRNEDDDADRPDGEGDNQGDDPNHDEPDQNDPDGDRPIDQKSCDDIRQLAENVGEEDRQFLENERPECFDGGTNEGGETDPDQGGETDPNNPDAADTDPFCKALEEEIANSDNEAHRAELEEAHARECAP